MAFEKTTLEVFKRRLKAGEYADATGARRAVGKAKEMSDAEKKKATAAIDAHSGPWAGKGNKAAKKTAKKAAVKKTASPVAKAGKKVAKKPAGKPAEAVPVAKKTAKKGARAKRVAKAGRAKPADKEARPATEQLAPKESAPPGVPALSHEDIANNPFAVKTYALEAIGGFTQAYHTYVAMAEKHPDFPLQAMGVEIGEGLQKAHALLAAGVGVVHEAAVRAGVIPSSTMAPATPSQPAPQDTGLPAGAQAVAEKAAAAAKKVHGVDQPVAASRPS